MGTSKYIHFIMVNYFVLPLFINCISLVQSRENFILHQSGSNVLVNLKVILFTQNTYKIQQVICASPNNQKHY